MYLNVCFMGIKYTCILCDHQHDPLSEWFSSANENSMPCLLPSLALGNHHLPLDYLWALSPSLNKKESPSLTGRVASLCAPYFFFLTGSWYIAQASLKQSSATTSKVLGLQPQASCLAL